MEIIEPSGIINLEDLGIELPGRQAGDIYEHNGQYFKKGKKGYTPISNFIIRPTESIWVNDFEVIKGEMVHPEGTYSIILERGAWHTRRNFLKEIPPIKLWYVGNDFDLQYIQAIVSSYIVPKRSGTRVLGYLEWNNTGIYVLPGEVISPEPVWDVIYLPGKGEHPFENIFSPLTLASEEIPTFIRDLFTDLFQLHASPSLDILLGWLFATPFKQHLMKLCAHFPILNIYGTRGSGKTSLCLLLMRMFGFCTSEIFSCTQTMFSWLRLLSSTNAFPLFFDEYKPWDMTKPDAQRVVRLIRRIYVGEMELRGKPNQEVIKYHLAAPMAILGEVSFTEPAILERIVPAPLSFQQLTDEYRQAYKRLSALPLEGFVSSYLKWAIHYSAEEHWQQAKERVQHLAHSASDRVKDNIAVCLFGLDCIKAFARHYEIELKNFDEEQLILFCLVELSGEVSGGRLAVDTLLEKLAYMAQCNLLHRNRDYRTEYPLILLRLEPCLDRFKQWARQIQYDGEVLDAKAYRQMLKERKNSYVQATSMQVRIGGGNYRCIALDAHKAKDLDLNFDGFFGANEVHEQPSGS